jgi:hypothetical protein
MKSIQKPLEKIQFETLLKKECDKYEEYAENALK